MSQPNSHRAALHPPAPARRRPTDDAAPRGPICPACGTALRVLTDGYAPADGAGLVPPVTAEERAGVGRLVLCACGAVGRWTG